MSAANKHHYGVNLLWQRAASDATNASSGSTAEASDIGNGTDEGDDEPAHSAPPSKRNMCRRL